jgi:UDP-glucose 4-epimerase
MFRQAPVPHCNSLPMPCSSVVPGAHIEVGPGLDFRGLGANYCGVFDNTRARTDLGFEPRFNLEQGVAHYIDTMRRLNLQPVTA